MRVAMAVGMMSLLIGCGTTMIVGTRVEDTPDNRAIYDVLENYRVAVEQRDAERLRGLISTKYFENASTTDRDEDDYGYDTLTAKVLPELRDNIKKVQYRVMLRKVVVTGNRASAEYEYFWKFLYSEGGREQWVAQNDFNRLDFEREDGAWKIVAGL